MREPEPYEKYTRHFLWALLKEARNRMSTQDWMRAVRTARGYAGGKSSPRPPDDGPALEKMAVAAMTPRSLAGASVQELGSLHRRLHQLAGNISKGGPGSGDFGHAGIPGQQGGSLPGGGAQSAFRISGVGFESEEEGKEYERQIGHLIATTFDSDTQKFLQNIPVEFELAPVIGSPGGLYFSEVRGQFYSPFYTGGNPKIGLKMPIGPNTLVHEVAHAIDYSSVGPGAALAPTEQPVISRSKGWKAIYKKSKRKLSAYGRTSEAEGWAESIVAYRQDPSAFREHVGVEASDFIQMQLKQRGLSPSTLKSAMGKQEKAQIKRYRWGEMLRGILTEYELTREEWEAKVGRTMTPEDQKMLWVGPEEESAEDKNAGSMDLQRQ